MHLLQDMVSHNTPSNGNSGTSIHGDAVGHWLHFAWLPVRIHRYVGNATMTGTNTWAWFRLVQRLRTIYGEVFYLEVTKDDMRLFYSKRN